MDIHVRPNEDRDIYYDGELRIDPDLYKISRMNLTWEAVKFEEDFMLIQLNFSIPGEISFDNVTLDTLVIDFKNKTNFVSSEILENLITN